MTADKIIENIKNGNIDRPLLREGEIFVDNKIYLTLYNANKKDLNMGRLFNTLEEGVTYYNNKLEKGLYYISCKEQRKPEEQKWQIELSI